MVFNATFNNILAISWRSVLLVEETGELGVWGGDTDFEIHWQTLSHNVVSSAPRHETAILIKTNIKSVPIDS
jgi:hypothetical protein